MDLHSTIPLPSSLRWAWDVRWDGEGRLLLAAGRLGVVRLRLGQNGGPEGGRQVELPAGLPSDPLDYAARLATSDRFLAAAAPFFTLAWKERFSGSVGSVGQNSLIGPDFLFDSVADLDVHGDRLAVVGSHRRGQQFSPDGAMAWLGSLPQGLSDLQALYHSSLTPFPANLAYCILMDISTVRFLSDGSLLVVPGVEAGILRYDRVGRMVWQWQAEEVGFDSTCDVEVGRHSDLARSPSLRQDWINGRRVVDEILPWRGGPAAVVRSFEDGSVHWELKVLKPGAVVTYELPFSSRSRWTRLKADLVGDRIAFLLVEYAVDDKPAVGPRLLVGTVRGEVPG